MGGPWSSTWSLAIRAPVGPLCRPITVGRKEIKTDWPHLSAWFELAKALLARAQVQGREPRRADLAAARTIADGLADLGYQDLANGVRAGCAMAALPRPILWLLGRVLGPVAKRFAGLFLRLQAKALTPPDRDH